MFEHPFINICPSHILELCLINNARISSAENAFRSSRLITKVD